MHESTHTGRLIAVYILFIITLAGAFSGHWIASLFWGLVTVTVAYPFIKHGSFSYPSNTEAIVVYARSPTA